MAAADLCPLISLSQEMVSSDRYCVLTTWSVSQHEPFMRPVEINYLGNSIWTWERTQNVRGQFDLAGVTLKGPRTSLRAGLDQFLGQVCHRIEVLDLKINTRVQIERKNRNTSLNVCDSESRTVLAFIARWYRSAILSELAIRSR